MKGNVLLSKENGYKLVEECRQTITSYTPTYKIEKRKKWFRKNPVDVKVYDDTPIWYSLNGGDWTPVLLNKLDDIKCMLDRGDDIHLSLTCYNELCKLAHNDEKSWFVNPIFIMNY